MAILAINGTDMPTPSAMEISCEPVGKEEINAAGNAVMDRLGMKRKIKCVWAYLTAENAAILLSAAQSENWNTLTYHDPANGSQQGTFRVEKSTAPVFRALGGTTEYRNVTIQFKER